MNGEQITGRLQLGITTLILGVWTHSLIPTGLDPPPTYCHFKG